MQCLGSISIDWINKSNTLTSVHSKKDCWELNKSERMKENKENKSHFLSFCFLRRKVGTLFTKGRSLLLFTVLKWWKKCSWLVPKSRERKMNEWTYLLNKMVFSVCIRAHEWFPFDYRHFNVLNKIDSLHVNGWTWGEREMIGWSDPQPHDTRTTDVKTDYCYSKQVNQIYIRDNYTLDSISSYWYLLIRNGLTFVYLLTVWRRLLSEQADHTN